MMKILPSWMVSLGDIIWMNILTIQIPVGLGYFEFYDNMPESIYALFLIYYKTHL